MEKRFDGKIAKNLEEIFGNFTYKKEFIFGFYLIGVATRFYNHKTKRDDRNYIFSWRFYCGK